MSPTRNLYVRSADAAVWDAAEMTAERRGQSVSELVVTALRQYLGISEPDLTKLDRPDVAEVVRAAIAEVTKPLADQLELVKADLARVAAMPPNPTETSMRDADADELRRRAAELLGGKS